MNRTARTIGLVLISIAMIAFIAGELIPLFTASSPKASRPAATRTQTNDPAASQGPSFTHEADGLFTRELDTIYQCRVELAESPQEIQLGMMYRKTMDADMGMLFMMPRNEMQSFWMRNTYVSLDIVYIGTDNRIVSIQRNARILNDTPLPSEGPADKVLELPGGTCDAHDIQSGDLWHWARL